MDSIVQLKAYMILSLFELLVGIICLIQLSNEKHSGEAFASVTGETLSVLLIISGIVCIAVCGFKMWGAGW